MRQFRKVWNGIATIRPTPNQFLGGAISGISVIAAVALIPAIIRLDKDLATVHESPEPKNKLEFDVSLERVKAIGGGITTIATIAGGIVLFLNFRVAQDKQITERFSKAVEQLGSDKIEVRLGGIYSLERIARDSPADHWTIMEILSAFIRGKLPIKTQEKTSQNDVQSLLQEQIQREVEFLSELKTDIRAALTVIQRRKKEQDPEKAVIDLSKSNFSRVILEAVELQKTNLEFTNLQGTFLRNANLQEASLGFANLQGANLWGGDLQEADLTKTNLQRAKLEFTNLQKALLWNTNLQEAKLLGANLQGADLSEANLQGADFSEANLQGADLTDRHQLDNVLLCQTTLPDGTKSDRDCKKIEAMRSTPQKH